jgi:hypothetical protein
MKKIIISLFSLMIISSAVQAQISDADTQRMLTLYQECTDMIQSVQSTGGEFTPQQDQRYRSIIKEMKDIVSKDPSLTYLADMLKELEDAMDSDAANDTDPNVGTPEVQSSTPADVPEKKKVGCACLFRYYNGAGEFVIYYGSGVDQSIGSASAGHSFGSNDETFMTWEDFGAIPIGEYKIQRYTGTKFPKIPNVFDLVPTSTTNTYGRSAFKIHGLGKTADKQTKTAAESSEGCIILNPTQRQQVRAYFDSCGGEVTLLVRNMD